MHYLILTLLLAAGPAYQAQTLDGPPLVGQLVELDAQHAALATDKGRVSLALDKLTSLAPSEEPPAAAILVPSSPTISAVRVDLVDGSRLAVAEYSSHKGHSRVRTWLCARGVELPGSKIEQLVVTDNTVELPPAAIAAVHFHADSPALTEQWARIAAQKIPADLLLTLKGESVEYHRGTIHDVDDKTVSFELDGESLSVPRSKVHGLIYYHASHDELPEAVGTLIDAGGSRWAVRTVALAGDKLQWTTPSGVSGHCGLDELVRLDLSRGKIVYLSDLEPQAVTATPFFGMAKELPSRAAFFRPRNDVNLESKPLRLGRQEFAKGLALHARTEMVFDLPGRYSRFEAVAGIDDDVRPRGNVHLIVRGNDKLLLETVLTGNDPPKPITLDVTGVRRLTILADFGGDLDVGDHLDLGNARIIK